MSDDEERGPYSVEWKPVAKIGDYVYLQQPGNAQQNGIYGRVWAVMALPFNIVDFGAIGAPVGSSVGPAAALIGAADQFQTGPDEFIQARLQLDSRDFGALPPGSDMVLQLFQPGPANMMWYSLASANNWVWNPTAQALAITPPASWPGQTEFYSWSIYTPNFRIVNNTGGALANTRVWFSGWHFFMEQQPNAPSDAAIAGSPSRTLIRLPLGPAIAQRSPNVPSA